MGPEWAGLLPEGTGTEQNRTSPAKMAKPIEVPLGLWTQVSPRNHVVDGGSDPPMGRGNFELGEGAAHCKVSGIPSVCGGDTTFYQITLFTC